MSEIASLTQSARQSAIARFQVLQPHLEQGVSLRQVALEAKIPYRTAHRWLSIYRRSGLAGLSRKARADIGGRRVLSPRMRELIEAFALKKPRLSVSALYREISRLAPTFEEEAPCYRMVYDVVRSLPTDLLTLAHEGKKAYSQLFELVHRREAERSNAIWQADHSLLDILLVCDDGGRHAKPWLTVVLDDYSRAVAGYFLSFEAPSALNTALALRQAIWRKAEASWQVCGIPEVLYTDNGSDFTSQHLEQTTAELKIRLIFSTPGVPRGRGRIERFFSTLTQLFLCTLSGYAPAGGAVKGTPVLKLAELDSLLRRFLLEDYHRRKHSETNAAPSERWEEGGFLPRTIGTLLRKRSLAIRQS
jgi:putative transposase